MKQRVKKLASEGFVFFISLLSSLSFAQEKPDLGRYADRVEAIRAESDGLEDQESGQFLELDQQFLYDAQTIGFDKDGKRYVFKGDVVLIGDGNVITADRIDIDYEARKLTAAGNVIFLSLAQVFTGREIRFWWESGDMEVDDASLIVNDKKRRDFVVREVLGVTAGELAFREDQLRRLQGLQNKKLDLRLEFLNSQQMEPSKQLLSDYELLLDQERITRAATVPNLSVKDETARKRFLKRRRFWEASRKQNPVDQFSSEYFKLSGAYIERKNENDFLAKQGEWTPCRCEDDESPAWSFQADEIKAQQEGYVSMSHPVLFIKGLPLMYIPYVRLPLKSKRQSGFLMPGIQTNNRKNGFVYTQPVFFAFNDYSDATVTTDIIQNRGTRLGVEYRYEARKYSGFSLNLEALRDKLWLQQGADRRDLLSYYLDEAEICRNIDGDLDASCVEAARERLDFPGNRWRGKQQWQGRYFFNPRWSLVSKGELISDHRYIEDLYVEDDYTAAFATRSQARAFASSKARLSYDGQDHFLALSSSYGDNFLLGERYQGQQLPLSMRYMSRKFALNSGRILPFKIYGSLFSDLKWIEDKPPSAEISKSDLGLGSGLWRRAGVNLVSSLSDQGVFRLDYFADAEFRAITHQGLSEKESSIASARTGLTFNLPLDGKGALPGFLQAESWGEDARVPTRYLHHFMDWSLTFSTRPSVVRTGPYSQIKDEKGASLVYFASDRDFLTPTDTRDVSNEDTMLQHQRISLGMTHRWRYYTQRWQVEFADLAQGSEFENLADRAKSELMSSRSPPVKDSSEILSAKEGKLEWHINRFRLLEDTPIEPVYFRALVSFDFEQEKKRLEQIKKNREIESLPSSEAQEKIVNFFDLPESWIGPFVDFGVNFSGYRLNSRLIYNVYKKASTSSVFSLGLPSFYRTSVAVGYVLEKSPELLEGSNQVAFRITRTRNLSLNSRLLPRLTLGVALVDRQVEGAEKKQYGTSFNVAYTDPSTCWGVRFLREKDLNQSEANANYILQLTVILMGNQRAGDLSPAFRRELPRLSFGS